MVDMSVVEELKQYIADRYSGEHIVSGKTAPQWLLNYRIEETTSGASFLKHNVAERSESKTDKHSLPATNTFDDDVKSKSSLQNQRDELKTFISQNKTAESFSVMLERLRKERGLTASQLYSKANIDRRLYSKIMGDRYYKPHRETVIVFGLALQLSLEEMQTLLNSAGFSLSHNSLSDLTIMYCCEKGIFNIFDVNALLVQMSQKTLG